MYHSFFDFWREKVSVRELSDDFGTVYDPSYYRKTMVFGN